MALVTNGLHGATYNASIHKLDEEEQDRAGLCMLSDN